MLLETAIRVGVFFRLSKVLESRNRRLGDFGSTASSDFVDPGRSIDAGGSIGLDNVTVRLNVC